MTIVHVFETGSSRGERWTKLSTIALDLLEQVYDETVNLNDDELEEYLDSWNVDGVAVEMIACAICNNFTPEATNQLPLIIKALKTGNGFCMEGEEVDFCFGLSIDQALLASVR